MPEKLFFGTVSTGSGVLAASKHVWTPFVSAYSGVVTKLRSYGTADGNIKLNLYDNAGNLLWADDTDHPVTGGSYVEHAISGSLPVVSAGQTYRLGYNSDTTSAVTYGGGGNMYVKGYLYLSYSAVDPMASGYVNYGLDIQLAAYGWEPPTITGCSESTLHDGEVDVVLSGTDFMTAADPVTLWLADGPVFATANKVAQTVTVQNDGSLTFTVSQGSLSTGTCYLFVETALGQKSSGFSITLKSVSSVDGKCYPAEIFRGAIFGEEFRGEERVESNGGTITGNASFDRWDGFYSDGTGLIQYEPVNLTTGTVVCLFRALTDGVLLGTADLSQGVPSPGWCIWVDEDGVHATHSDGVTLATECFVTGEYLMSREHVLSYVIEPLSERHTLYVDDRAAMEATNQVGPFGDTVLQVGGPNGFAGAIHAVKLFNTALEPREHALYARLPL